MSNIGAVLKQEIARVSRREIRTQVETIRKASAQHRRHIAALRRQLEMLERQIALFQRGAKSRVAAAADEAEPQKVRFVAKGLASQRARLGLSASDYGRLVGVSSQSIYNWEQGHATPRAGQLRTLATLRGIGKREAQQRLDQLAPRTVSKRAPKTAGD